MYVLLLSQPHLHAVALRGFELARAVLSNMVATSRTWLFT